MKRHQLRGQRHSLNDACPLPATHPQARLHAITEGASPVDPARLLAALATVAELQGWLDRTEDPLVTRFHQGRLSWVAIGDTWDGLKPLSCPQPPPPSTRADSSAPPTALSAP